MILVSYEPVRGARREGQIGMPRMEGEHEIQGLRFWNGDPTVRLLTAADDLGAALLERCEPGRHYALCRSASKTW